MKLKENKTKKKPFFSIVIPTLNEEKYLPLLLEDLTQESDQDFEVIHVDGNSEDKTVDLAQKFTSKIDITCITTKTRNVSFQRNLGAKKSEGKWVVFMDADVRTKKNFVKNLKKEISKNENIEAFTVLVRANEYPILFRILTNIVNLIFIIFANIKPVAYGSMIVVKREVIEKTRFDEELKITEDHYFVNSVVKNGFDFKILSNPKYTVSLRRFDKHNNLQIVYTYIKAFTLYMLGIKSSKFDYAMNGGKDY